MTRAAILSAAAALVAEAANYVGHTEAPPGSNRSPQIDSWLQAVHSPIGSPWCMAFAWCMGRDALGMNWPVPKAGRVQTVVDWAMRELFYREDPRMGDLAVLYFPALARYAHVGIVRGLHSETFSTIEGNTVPDGSGGNQREGYGIFRRTRHLTPRWAFIRWTAALR